MKMQGSKLGFRTDRDKTGGYPVQDVKRCLIEAVLLGLQPYGNQFNIIAGNMYATKEGCAEMLSKIEGLKYTLICGLPTYSKAKDSAAIDVKINWNYNGNSNSVTIPIALKVGQYDTLDGLNGKATRKGRAWLISNITGIEIPEGDIKEAIIIKQTDQQPEIDKLAERLILMINDCTTKEDYESLRNEVVSLNNENVTAIYNQKGVEFGN
jgi:hypothetical protein